MNQDDNNGVMTAQSKTFSLAPTNMQEAMDQATMLAGSSIIPEQYRGKPQDILVAIQMGLEVGLKPLQALKNIAVIKGTPTIWGDAAIALVRTSPLCEYVIEKVEYQTVNNVNILVATCTVKRKGEPEQTRIFDQNDATTAKLWGRNVWATYPKRMLQMRARSWALRDVFPDVLNGLGISEEEKDKEEIELNARGGVPTQEKRRSNLNSFAKTKKPIKKENKPDPVIVVDQAGDTFTQEDAEDFFNEQVNYLTECETLRELQQVYGAAWTYLKGKGFNKMVVDLEKFYRDQKEKLG